MRGSRGRGFELGGGHRPRQPPPKIKRSLSIYNNLDFSAVNSRLVFCDPPERIAARIARRNRLAEIDRQREKSGASPVKANNCPEWLRIRAIRVIREKHPGHWRYRSTSAWPAFADAIKLSDSSDAFDHVGITVVGGRQVLVSEPYDLYQNRCEAAQRFAKFLGIVVEFSDVSWHRPGQTKRIIFWEK